MQVKSLRKNSQVEANKYLRVAAIASRNTYCFLYIGNDHKSVEFLSANFTSGYTAGNFDAAKKMLKKTSNTDIIIIDLAYDRTAMKDFQVFLTNRDLLSIPVIYASHQLAGQEFSKHHDIIDDVIDLQNWQYDFSSKVSFLKKTKEYSSPGKKQVQQYSPFKYLLKRTLDIIVAAFLIFLLLPVLLLIAVAIRLESKGPIFYNSNRAGRGFRIFKFYKFRTMIVNADKKIEALAHLNQYGGTEGANFFKISNDPRITKIGKFLRNTSLDELPQLFNVLKGDMSLVGNRPLPLYEAATLTTNEFVERFMAPAGITGLWQIKKRGQTEMSAEERISLDISYARNSNLLYDLWIMANTPKALFQKNNV